MLLRIITIITIVSFVSCSTGTPTDQNKQTGARQGITNRKAKATPVRRPDGSTIDTTHNSDVPEVWDCPVYLDKDPKHAKMYMLFRRDNALVFKNGFEYYNPGRWEYIKKEDALYLYLPRLGKHQKISLRDYKLNGRILDYDLDKKKYIKYKFSTSTWGMAFFGFLFKPVRQR